MRRALYLSAFAFAVPAVALQLPACSESRYFGGDDSSGTGAASNEAGAAGASAGGSSSGGKSGGGGGSGGNGSTGGGETGGSGGSTPQPGELGASCKADAECGSSQCVDGVCCESACDGICETCDATGQCVAAESDTACPAVTCGPKDNDCIDYGTALEGGTCKSQGVCKTSDDCPTSPKPASSACDVPGSDLGICDGQGECGLPSVDCGGVTCEIASTTCCYTLNSSTVGRQCTDSCEDTWLGSDPGRTRVECDDHGDCRTGYLCALFSSSGESKIECREAAAANGPGEYSDTYEVCISPTMGQKTCHNGELCSRSFAALPGWTFCHHP